MFGGARVGGIDLVRIPNPSINRLLGLADFFYSNVVFLSYFQGANNSTTFIDEKGSTITRNGNVIISTAQSKYSGSSAFFNASTDVLKATSPTANQFVLPGDFTCEGWYYLTSLTNAGLLFWLANNDAVNRANLRVNSNGSIDIEYFGAGVLLTSAAGVFVINQWNHVAFTRSGSSLRIFYNGNQVASTTNNNTFGTDNVIQLGGLGTSNFFRGYMENVRITKGVGRYTSNFTIPSTSFPNY